MKVSGEELEEVIIFKYFRVMIVMDEDMEGGTRKLRKEKNMGDAGRRQYLEK